MKGLFYLLCCCLFFQISCSNPKSILPKNTGTWSLNASIEALSMDESRIDFLSWSLYEERYLRGGFISQEDWPQFASSFSFPGWQLRYLDGQITDPFSPRAWRWQSLDTTSYAKLRFDDAGNGVFVGKDSLLREFQWSYDKKEETVRLLWVGLQDLPTFLDFKVLTDKADKQVWEANYSTMMPNPFTADTSEATFLVRWQLRKADYQVK